MYPYPTGEESIDCLNEAVVLLQEAVFLKYFEYDYLAFTRSMRIL